MEKWIEIHKGIIPLGRYQTMITNGEETGLLIKLESERNIVNINFGAVSAFRMLDEGIVMGGLFEENEISKYKGGNFSNTIYKANGGEFARSIKYISQGFYEALELNHYIVITMNYLIEIISRWEPTIDIKTISRENIIVI